VRNTELILLFASDSFRTCAAVKIYLFESFRFCQVRCSVQALLPSILAPRTRVVSCSSCYAMLRAACTKHNSSYSIAKALCRLSVQLGALSISSHLVVHPRHIKFGGTSNTAEPWHYIEEAEIFLRDSCERSATLRLRLPPFVSSSSAIERAHSKAQQSLNTSGFALILRRWVPYRCVVAAGPAVVARMRSI
jgi:hypothetical protein